MKKTIIGVVFIVSFILFISVASAGWWDILKQIFGIGGGERLGGELGQMNPWGSSDYSCTETDSGRDYYNYGETNGIMFGTSSDYQYQYDYCLNERFYSNRLQEYYCENNKVKSETYQCDYKCESGECKSCVPQCSGKQCGDDGCGGICTPGCSAGYKCENGQCILICINDAGCSDLGRFCDGNIPYTCSYDPYVYGCIKRKNEAACSFGYKCENGECVQIPDCATDSDCNNFDDVCSYGVCASGKCEIRYNSTLDVCRPVSEECDIIENCMGASSFCPIDLKKIDGSVCTGGTCENGACVKEGSSDYTASDSICTETDSGFEVYSRGTTSGMNENGVYLTKTDECIDARFNGLLKEYYCEDNKIVNYTYLCDICDDGKCLDLLLYPPLLYTAERRNIDPNRVFIGDVIIVEENLLSPISSFNLNSIKDSKFQVLKENQLLYSASLTYSKTDTFTNSEGATFLFNGQWLTSNLKEGSSDYQVKVIFELKNGKTKEETRNFNLNFKKPDPTKCKEVISGHNKPEADRANIVFLFGGYNELTNEQRAEIASDAIDFDGSGIGIFSVEPFKSNKDKFNIWYVNQNFDVGGQSNPYDNIDSYELVNKEDPCIFNNRFPIEISNRAFVSSSDLGGGTSSISVPTYTTGDCSFVQYCKRVHEMNYDYGDYNNDGVINDRDTEIIEKCRALGSGICEENSFIYTSRFGFESAIVHEFGHQFGNLKDEYLFSVDSVYEGTTNDRNCYAGLLHTKEECLENAQWKEFIGQGSGELEVGCFEGCSYARGIFRPTFNSIMGWPSESDPGFGVWNEYLIQLELDKYTGV